MDGLSCVVAQTNTIKLTMAGTQELMLTPSSKNVLGT